MMQIIKTVDLCNVDPENRLKNPVFYGLAYEMDKNPIFHNFLIFPINYFF